MYTVPSRGPGIVSVLGKPRPGDWLDDDLARLARAGVDVLVSLLTPAEIAETGLSDEPAAAARAGLSFLHAPIAPDAVFAATVLAELGARYAAGEHVAVHCRFGVGRSATVAAAVLVRAGHDPVVVWRDLAAVRGVPVPDTPQQRAWVDGLGC